MMKFLAAILFTTSLAMADEILISKMSKRYLSSNEVLHSTLFKLDFNNLLVTGVMNFKNSDFYCSGQRDYPGCGIFDITNSTTGIIPGLVIIDDQLIFESAEGGPVTCGTLKKGKVFGKVKLVTNDNCKLKVINSFDSYQLFFMSK